MRKYAPYCAGTNPALSKRSPVTYWGEFRNGWAAGTSFENVVKAQVFLTDLMNFNGFDEVWREFFPTPPPRTTVGTTGLLVRDARVEIDLVATMP